MNNYGLQLYSVRDVTETDLKSALRAVSELGYKYVEFAGFFGNSAEDVKSWLDEYGLVASGTHTLINDILPQKIDETIKYHKIIGADRLIVPIASWETEELMEENIAAMNEADRKLRQAGIRLGYHNHSFEFFTTPYGKIVEDEIFNRTDIEMQIDTFWLFNSGIDPVPYLEAHKDRIGVIHLKDGISKRGVGASFDNAENDAVGKSVGEGETPVKDICKWAEDNGVLVVVESEGLDPTGLKEVKRCIDFLNDM